MVSKKRLKIYFFLTENTDMVLGKKDGYIRLGGQNSAPREGQKMSCNALVSLELASIRCPISNLLCVFQWQNVSFSMLEEVLRTELGSEWWKRLKEVV